MNDFNFLTYLDFLYYSEHEHSYINEWATD